VEELDETLVAPLAKSIARERGFADRGFRTVFNTNREAGQTVFHLHFHIIPRKEGETLKPHAGQMADQTKLAATAEKIRKRLGTG